MGAVQTKSKNFDKIKRQVNDIFSVYNEEVEYVLNLYDLKDSEKHEIILDYTRRGECELKFLMNDNLTTYGELRDLLHNHNEKLYFSDILYIANELKIQYKEIYELLLGKVKHRYLDHNERVKEFIRGMDTYNFTDKQKYDICERIIRTNERMIMFMIKLNLRKEDMYNLVTLSSSFYYSEVLGSLEDINVLDKEYITRICNERYMNFNLFLDIMVKYNLNIYEICYKAISRLPEKLKYVPLKYKDYKICSKAVISTNGWHALKYVPKLKEFSDPFIVLKFCYEAISRKSLDPTIKECVRLLSIHKYKRDVLKKFFIDSSKLHYREYLDIPVKYRSFEILLRAAKKGYYKFTDKVNNEQLKELSNAFRREHKYEEQLADMIETRDMAKEIILETNYVGPLFVKLAEKFDFTYDEIKSISLSLAQNHRFYDVKNIIHGEATYDALVYDIKQEGGMVYIDYYPFDDFSLDQRSNLCKLMINHYSPWTVIYGSDIMMKDMSMEQRYVLYKDAFLELDVDTDNYLTYISGMPVEAIYKLIMELMKTYSLFYNLTYNDFRHLYDLGMESDMLYDIIYTYISGDYYKNFPVDIFNKHNVLDSYNKGFIDFSVICKEKTIRLFEILVADTPNIVLTLPKWFNEEVF